MKSGSICEDNIMKQFFRNIRNNIELNNKNIEPKAILVTSANNGEGKSFIARNLAIIYAKANKKVLLIDADMKRGTQHEIFEIENKKGLSNILLQKKEYNIEIYAKNSNIENLDIITRGEYISNLEDYLLVEEISKFIELTKKNYDTIIFDGASSYITNNAIVFSKYVDSTIIVTQYGKTKIQELEQVVKSITSIGGKISGIIINKFTTNSKEYKRMKKSNNIALIKK